MNRHMRAAGLAVMVTVVAAFGPACAATTSGGAVRGATPSAAGTRGAADGPSEATRMICAAEAGDDIAGALGVRPSEPPQATWRDHLYTCRYVYPSGVMVLSVKELADAAATDAYYASLQAGLASHTSTDVEGQPGFIAPDGSIVVRKDFKVLRVDVSGLPEQFGQPPHSRFQAAFAVASVIMSCWRGD